MRLLVSVFRRTASAFFRQFWVESLLRGWVSRNQHPTIRGCSKITQADLSPAPMLHNCRHRRTSIQSLHAVSCRMLCGFVSRAWAHVATDGQNHNARWRKRPMDSNAPNELGTKVRAALVANRELKLNIKVMFSLSLSLSLSLPRPTPRRRYPRLAASGPWTQRRSRARLDPASEDRLTSCARAKKAF